MNTSFKAGSSRILITGDYSRGTSRERAFREYPKIKTCAEVNNDFFLLQPWPAGLGAPGRADPVGHDERSFFDAKNNWTLSSILS